MAFGNYYGMNYQPMYNPAMPDMLNQYKAPQQQNSGLIWVQGESGAKSFIVAPGQSVLLMDSESSRFYLKSADASGMPLPLRIFGYSELSAQPEEKEPALKYDLGQYVTKAELDERLAQLIKPSKKAKEDPDNA